MTESSESKGLSGNKGEWSEVYTLLKLVSDKKLFPGDARLKSILGFCYPILEIIRSNKLGDVRYRIKEMTVELISGDETKSVDLETFTLKAIELFTSIKSLKSSEAIPSLDDFLNDIFVTTMKAKSSSKTDIRIMVHDVKTGLTPTLGFSIKSELGDASSLLNASKATNIIYRLGGSLPNQDLMQAVNAIDSKNFLKDRVNYMLEAGHTLQFSNCEDRTFENNLILIDSRLPEILAALLLVSYQYGIRNLHDCLEMITKANPIGYDVSTIHPYYSYKIKKLLVEIAVGMTPKSPWDGIHDATGGFIIVKTTGDLVCYHVIERNSFEDYLLMNTKFETASTSRHGFGLVYPSGDGYCFKLNMQIRFLG